MYVSVCLFPPLFLFFHSILRNVKIDSGAPKMDGFLNAVFSYKTPTKQETAEFLEHPFSPTLFRPLPHRL